MSGEVPVRMKAQRVSGFVMAALWTLMPAIALAASPRLSLPIACEIGGGCQIQNYVDDDAGPGARDFACGTRTYDGHKGTDFRIRDAAAMAKGVKVLAAAAGIVKAVRDDMSDVSIRGRNAADVRDRECGNGVLLQHGDGWVTQYCHLRRGSVRVEPGKSVARGEVLGEVGLSGLTEFAHVHFELRNGGAVVDPFTGEKTGAPLTGRCEHGAGNGSLWQPQTLAALAYKPAAFLSAGFAGEPVKLDATEQAPPTAPSPASPALVAYVRVLGVRAGDTETLTVTAPDGVTFGTKGPATIPTSKALWLSFFGRKRHAEPWRPGQYAATYRLERDGRVLIEERFSTRLD